jgi:hypothetical protein
MFFTELIQLFVRPRINSVRRFNPFQSLHYKKFLQPGDEGDLNACIATKWTALPENLVQQGHKVKNAKIVLTGTIQEDKFSTL